MQNLKSGCTYHRHKPKSLGEPELWLDKPRFRCFLNWSRPLDIVYTTDTELDNCHIFYHECCQSSGNRTQKKRIISARHFLILTRSMRGLKE